MRCAPLLFHKITIFPASRALSVGCAIRSAARWKKAATGRFSLFPRPERLANCTVEDLAPLRCGFRARYLIDAAQKVSGGQVDLEQLRTLPLMEAREQLMQIVGVGVKVADCALLYGLHRLEVFPMDVWMKRVMTRWFAGKEPDCFGPYAGIAQQYLFHYSRNHPECFTDGERLRKEYPEKIVKN